MSKTFFETFQNMNVADGLEGLFREVYVERVEASRVKNTISIHILCPKLISRVNLRTMERNINKQLFSDTLNSVRIFDRYDYSGKYSPEKLMDVYDNSITEIIREKGNVIYNIYKSSDITFKGNNLDVICEDSLIAKDKSKELKKTLEYIFNVMFGFDIQINIECSKPCKVIEHNDEIVKIEMKVPKTVNDNTIEKKGSYEKAANRAKEATNKDNSSKGAYDKTKKSFTKTRLPKDPSIFYGRNFDGEFTEIIDIQDEIGEVRVKGKIIQSETRELRNEKAIITFALTDFTDTITGKIFVKKEEIEEYEGDLKKGCFVEVKGIALYDKYAKEISISSIVGIRKIESFVTIRQDTCEEKRVELHCHTKMSDNDGVAEVKDLVKRAIKWGHKAIAITDHGVVQAFPDAAGAIEGDFKVIYGVEGYIVDDVKSVVENSDNRSLHGDYVVFDIETTGINSSKEHIIEIGACKVSDGKIIDTFSTFINPQVPIPYNIEQLTSINDEMVSDADTIDIVLPKFLEFVKGCALVAHNASFDVGFINKKAQDLNIETDFVVIDTVGMARVLLPNLKKFKLDRVCKELGISLLNHHRAVDDARATADIFIKFVEMLDEENVTTLDELNDFTKVSADVIKRMPSYHAIILAKNETGRRNLYKLVSLSHINYFSRRPRIPKSVYLENKEGLIIGSACEAGELYKAILNNSSDEEIERLVNFYDYLEIQPLGNNQFMIESEKFDIASKDDLIEINKKIVKLGEDYNKLVVGTCDVHFLDPEDEVYRRIIMSSKGFDDADNQAPLFLRTTNEMLEEFSYLGEEKAKEIVVTNTNKIADMIEKISPVSPDKCPPVIENSDETLRKICYDKAISMYGPKLPKPVKERLDHELNSIIKNGFAVMYIIAQKLVWKSVEDGYLVGSRGSVGSSFVATMSGITEVNPLPAHYYCTNCFYSDFDSDEVKKFAGSSGCDMPDKNCPVCNKPLIKDGHDIPFETFLGFYGDKEPDIDLNFSGEYQSKAHAYTEVIFGEGQTFRAGTIGSIAEKTAFGLVKGYFSDRNVSKRNCEIVRIAQGCEGVKRTTGQHPGGIVVLPHGEQIYKFTPVQRPANDQETSTITTHFDYHKIDHNLLKLDILGHDDPTMIRMLEDLTGLKATTIRLDEENVLSLFESTKALKLVDGELMDCDLGSLGIPEFGTEFVMQMLRDTKPKNFSDLVRISGLSHGTDVWLNNAQYFIQNGDCTLSTAICTRDDIMIYLINKGVENGLAFKIMESVRKGKGLKPEMEEAMLASNVPEWYIESCKRIKYMFPKAHAAAYVMMAFRIAYFKVYYPLAYYAAFFSIRAKAFNYEVMCLGKEKLEQHMKDYKKRLNEANIHPENKPSKKEMDMYGDMRIVQEMYVRGFEFMPIDIFRASARHFQIIDGKLMPSLNSIDGMGDKAAEGVVEGVKKGKFLSKDDFKTRCGVSSTTTDTMSRLGLLGNLPESNQISFMDMFDI